MLARFYFLNEEDLSVKMFRVINLLLLIFSRFNSNTPIVTLAPATFKVNEIKANKVSFLSAYFLRFLRKTIFKN